MEQIRQSHYHVLLLEVHLGTITDTRKTSGAASVTSTGNQDADNDGAAEYALEAEILQNQASSNC